MTLIHPATPAAAPSPPDASTPDFVVYRYDDGPWFWELQRTDGKVLATCGPGYMDQKSCLEGIEFLRSVAPLARTRTGKPPRKPAAPASPARAGEGDN